MLSIRTARELKHALENFSAHLELKWPVMAWYPAASPPAEAMKATPRCVTGSQDPAGRQYLPDDLLSLSLPAGRFLELGALVPESFRAGLSWRRPNKNP